jgi:hypothetical protein
LLFNLGDAVLFYGLMPHSDKIKQKTKQQAGFISAEWMISTADDGSTCFHL